MSKFNAHCGYRMQTKALNFGRKWLEMRSAVHNADPYIRTSIPRRFFFSLVLCS